MPNYRRYYVPDSLVFITSVTNERIPLFREQKNIDLFYSTVEKVNQIYSFELLAHVLLPDHFHWLIKMPSENKSFSSIIHSVKRNFTLNYKKSNEITQPISIWQKRFWDHVIRNEEDLKNHLDYIHWNPVKHGLAIQPNQYRFSSFNKFQDEGVYPKDWGLEKEPVSIKDMDFE